MAKVLMCYFSEKGEAMFDGLSKSLLENGNDVFRLNIRGNLTHYNPNELSKIKSNKLLDKIIKFQPDVVLSYNNSLPVNVLEQINCPVCILDADTPDFFWNKEIFKNLPSNIKFLGFQSHSKFLYENILSLKMMENKNYLFLPSATSFDASSMSIDKNISFIATNFSPSNLSHNIDFYNKTGQTIYNEIRSNYFSRTTDLYERHANGMSYESFVTLYNEINHFHVGSQRIDYLSTISDIGLTIYGVRWDTRVAYFNFQVAFCYNPEPIISKEDNEIVYNSSKISVNISHPQAITAFAWRVMDIMATNSCILMEDKSDWHILFGSYISEEVKNAIIYSDRYDMREKAKILLSNETLRLKCVQECQFAISKNGRWEHRLNDLGNFLKINLTPKININEKKYIYIQGDDLRFSHEIIQETITAPNLINDIHENTGITQEEKIEKLPEEQIDECNYIFIEGKDTNTIQEKMLLAINPEIKHSVLDFIESKIAGKNIVFVNKLKITNKYKKILIFSYYSVRYAVLYIPRMVKHKTWRIK